MTIFAQRAVSARMNAPNASLLPAAASLWQVPLARLQGRTRWEAGQLVAPGLAPLPLAALALAVLRLPLRGCCFPFPFPSIPQSGGALQDLA